jgi:hypothetical protein
MIIADTGSSFIIIVIALWRVTSKGLKKVKRKKLKRVKIEVERAKRSSSGCTLLQ